MPESSAVLFEKLVRDGFAKEDVLLVDNGSDKFPMPDQTNFKLPYNIRFTGQAYMALTYLLDFFDDQNYLLITTSGRLLDEINYKEKFEKHLITHAENYGFISAGLFGGLTPSNAPDQMFAPQGGGLAKVYRYQPIVMMVSRKLLEVCRRYSAAYFNLKLKRGWGIDRELQFMANLTEINCYVDRSLPVEWLTNSTHASGRADESTKSYWQAAGSEMEKCFELKYGSDWEKLFLKAFAGDLILNSSGDILNKECEI
ncbi:hypothetical protein [Limnohabitans sp.]|uniref:hypothetical protein n=1 Tax=Limnohabitans sp. TaxID=1907725 RepID=UPI002AFEF958|nr:hypothetical protein [Limnohabitans sp.]